jgi:hypothetical protein
MKDVLFITNGNFHILHLKFAKCIFGVLFVSVVSGSNLESWTASSFNLAHRANAIAAGRHGVSRRIVQLCG